MSGKGMPRGGFRQGKVPGWAWNRGPVAVILWAALILLLYLPFAFRALSSMGNPFRVPSGAAFHPEVLGGSLHILLAASALAALLLSWGARIRDRMGLGLPDPWIRIPFELGLGAMVPGLFWLGTGLLGLWYPALWIPAGILLFVPAALDLRALFRKGWGGVPRGHLGARGGSGLLAVLAASYFILALLHGLVPETFYDSMVYHLAVPAEWMARHGIRDLPGNFFSHYPFGAELLFLNGLVLQGTETARMLHVLAYGAAGLLAGGWARELAGPMAGRLALGLVLTLPVLCVNAWTTQVEGFLTLSVLLFLYAFHRALEGELRWILAAGLFAGLALSVKYTALLPIGGALAVGLLLRLRVFHPVRWGAWAWILAGPLILFLPWILKNFVFAGEPFFPYLVDGFGERSLSAGGFERLVAEQRGRIASGTLEWLLLPWKLTFAGPDGYNFCGPAALALLPAFFLVRRDHPALRFLALLAAFLFVAGLVTTHILRFSLPAFGVLFVLMGAALGGSKEPSIQRTAIWVAALAALGCLPGLLAISARHQGAGGIWTGFQTRAAYLGAPERITPYQDMAGWIRRNVPAEARLLLVGDARGLYHGRTLRANSVFDDQDLARFAREEKDATGIHRRVRETGVDALVVNLPEGFRTAGDYGHYALSPREWERLDDFIQRGTQGVYLKDLQAVYRVLPELRDRPLTDPNLLVYLSPEAIRYVRAAARDDGAAAMKALGEVRIFHPRFERRSEPGGQDPPERGGP